MLEERPLHGYAVIEALSARTDGSLGLPTGTVYPALRRLERAGWIEGEWSTVDGSRRRTYRLSRSGRRELARERDSWREFTSVIGGVLGKPA